MSAAKGGLSLSDLLIHMVLLLNTEELKARPEMKKYLEQ